ncbi:MAG: Wzz/FepE/Etk N-terminal domain-containing protein [Marinobacter sp.]|nr:Wzz/FepE/Etk N-terminal domain-containing protein [Marinobacter sp.]
MTQPVSPSLPEDEISLVDLAATLVRRRLMICVVFLLCAASGGLYVVFAPAQYEYVSLLQVGKLDASTYLTSPAGVIATLESDWWPGARAQYTTSTGTRLPFDIHFDNPKDTALVKLVSMSSPDNRELIKTLHQTLIDNAMAAQRSELEGRKGALKQQLAALDQSLQQLKDSRGNDSATAVAGIYQKKADIEAQLQSLQPPKAVAVARQSAENKSASLALVLTLASLLGLMAGVFLAFFAEFVSQVRKKLS